MLIDESSEDLGVERDDVEAGGRIDGNMTADHGRGHCSMHSGS